MAAVETCCLPGKTSAAAWLSWTASSASPPSETPGKRDMFA